MSKKLNDVASMAAKLMGTPRKQVEVSESDEVPNSDPAESQEDSKEEAVHKALAKHHSEMAAKHSKLASESNRKK